MLFTIFFFLCFILHQDAYSLAVNSLYSGAGRIKSRSTDLDICIQTQLFGVMSGKFQGSRACVKGALDDMIENACDIKQLVCALVEGPELE